MQNNNYVQYLLITDLFSSWYTLPNSNLIDDISFSNIKFFIKKLLKSYKNLSYVKLVNLYNNRSKSWIIKNNVKSNDIANYQKFFTKIVNREKNHVNFRLIKKNLKTIDPISRFCLQEIMSR
jgi:hypothetical protein